MATSRARPLSARFDQFEVDFTCNELRNAGRRLPVQEKPFQVLRLLLESEGKVVKREQLRDALWPADTFVDFEHGVNVAIRKLRYALGDSPDNPKFIETLPKLGYRFIVPMEWVPETSGTDGPHIVLPMVRSAPDPPKSEPEPPKPQWWKRRVTVAAAACVLAGAMLYPQVAPLIDRQVRMNELEKMTVVPLTALPGLVWSPTFSPDGSQIAFAWNGGNLNALAIDVYVKVIDTDNLLRLTHNGREGRPAWSPDGKYIAFWRFIPPDSGVFLISPLGGPERRVAPASCDCMADSRISWSPDGKRLAFLDHPESSHLDVMESDLVVVSLDSMERHQVKTGCNLVDTPAFSPRGDYLAWTCNDNPSSVPIYLQRQSNGSITQLLHGVDGIGGLAWSRDGGRIIFSTSNHPGEAEGGRLWEIALARPDHPERLPIGHDAYDFAVNAQGNRLAFVQGRANANIWRVALSGPPQPQKIVASSREQTAPDYSPDGTQIAFQSTRSGSDEVWICDSDGSNAVQLSSFGINTTGSPHWSPDGKLIAFDSRAGAESNIYIVDPHGGSPRKLNIDIRGNSNPSWSHDGRWIYFVNGDDAHNPTIWKVPSTGGHAVQIAGHRALFPLESPDGQYVYFSRDWLLWRVRTDGTEENQVDGMTRLAGRGEAWRPFGSGIYYLTYADNNDKEEIDYFDLTTKKVRPVFVPEKPLGMGWMGGLPVSPDGKWLLFAQTDQISSDLMMVENWR